MSRAELDLMRKWSCFVVAATLMACVSGTGAQAQGSRAPLTADQQEKALLARVRDYLALREAASRTLPKLEETEAPSQISSRGDRLAAAIKAARPHAKAGDILGVARERLSVIVADDWSRRSASERQALMSELPTGEPPRINETYPSTLPLVTVPASLLDRLPKLPEDLEYRLFGRHLLLRDAKANLVVDILRDVRGARRGPKDGA